MAGRGHVRRRDANATWRHNPLAAGKRDPLTPNAARTITAADAGRGPAPETVNVAERRVTVCRLLAVGS